MVTKESENREGIAALTALRAMELYIYNVSPLERALKLFPDAEGDYIREWVDRFLGGEGMSPFKHMDGNTLARYLEQALDKYGLEAATWVAIERGNEIHKAVAAAAEKPFFCASCHGPREEHYELASKPGYLFCERRQG